MIDNDKLLLKKAAKAAGIELRFLMNGTIPFSDGPRVGEWNPLTDDGDALRLAVKTNLWIGQHDDGVTVSDAYGRFKGALEEDYGDDPCASTRRAIVRAAAEIGKAMV